MNVWIFGNLVFPNGNASTNRLTEIALGFKRNGWQVKLIPLEKPKSIETKLRGSNRGIPYEYIQEIHSNNWQLVNFLFSYIVARKHYKILESKAKHEGVSLIFCGSASPYSIYLLNFLAKRLGINFVYDLVEDPLATWLTRKIVFSQKEIIVHLLNFIRIPILYFFALRLPSYLTSITQSQINGLIKLGFISDKIFLLPIIKYIDETNVNLNDNISILKNTIIHSGSTYFPKDGIKVILLAIKNLVNKGIDIKLEFYGPIGISEKNKIEDFTSSNNLNNNIKVVGLVELSELFEIQKKAFVLICFKPNNLQNKYNFATKIIDYLYSSRPIILSNIPIHNKYFKDKSNAFICDKNTEDALVETIEYLYTHKELATFVGKSGKQLLKVKFNSTILIRDLISKIDINSEDT